MNQIVLLWTILFFFLIYFSLRRKKSESTPLTFDTKIYVEEIKRKPRYKIKWLGSEPLSPEQKRIAELHLKLIDEIISKIKKENPYISDEELEERVKFEYEKEKMKYPELTSIKLGSFKIKRTKAEKIE